MTGSDAEQFSLRWNNFHSNLSSGFHTLLQEVELVDVTLAADGQFLQAHKIVLSICSPYFKQLFRANPCKHPIVILKDVSYKELVAILQFMYQGEVNVRQEELAEFLKTAEMLQIKGLTGSESDQEAEGSSPSSLPHLPPPAPPRPRSQVCLQESRLQPRLQGVSQVYKSRNETEKLTPLLRDEGSSAPPVKRMKSDVSPTTAQLAQVEGQTKTEFDARTPKIEPVDLDSDPEEDNEHIQHNSLSILDINSGESSQSHDISLAPTGNMDSSPGVLQDTSQDTNQGTPPWYSWRPSRRQDFKCTLCDKKFVNKSNLNIHMRDNHRGAGPLVCLFCFKQVKNQSCLRVHMYQRHRNVATTMKTDSDNSNPINS